MDAKRQHLPEHIREIIEELSKPDHDWMDLYDWFTEFKAQHHLLTRQLLRLCNVPTLGKYCCWLSKSGRSMRVPSFEGSIGRELREKLQVARANPPIVPQNLPFTWQDTLLELFDDPNGEMKQSRLMVMHISETDLEIGMIKPSATTTWPNTADCPKVTEQDMQDACNKVKSLVPEDVKIEFSKIELM